MTMDKTLRQRMFQEMEQQDLFHQAHRFGQNYVKSSLDRHVYPDAAAVANLASFDEDMPETGGDGTQIIQQLHQDGSPATVSQIGGRYFGFVNGGVVPTGLAARLLADYWDQNAALYVMSPTASVLEAVCEKWLRQLLGLPDRVVAGFVSGTSAAILCGLAAGRYRVFQNAGWDINKQGFNGAPKVRIVTGRHTHATVLKAVALLGFGTDTIEWVDTDAQGRIIPEKIPPLDDRTILVLQAGNVGSGSFDPFDQICDAANKAGAWVHIDGAFGLWAAGSQQLSHLTSGADKANSWSVDGHKTLNTPYDNGIVLCDDGPALNHALQLSGSYIVYSGNRDGMMFTPEMSRRARAVELWATLKYLGRQGVDELLVGLHERAVQMARELDAARFKILNDVVFNQVLVTCENDALTTRTMEHIQASGECWVGGATWNGVSVIRVSVCSWATTQHDITRSVRAFVAALNTACQEKNPA
jgi:glutamate/tyrosine decarboxylase-like PLP-dependent enzyme